MVFVLLLVMQRLTLVCVYDVVIACVAVYVGGIIYVTFAVVCGGACFGGFVAVDVVDVDIVVLCYGVIVLYDGVVVDDHCVVVIIRIWCCR